MIQRTDIESRVDSILEQPIDLEQKAQKLVAYVKSLEGDDSDYAYTYAANRLTREIRTAVQKGRVSRN